jgi:hypothetical protein
MAGDLVAFLKDAIQRLGCGEVLGFLKLITDVSRQMRSFFMPQSG